MIAGARATASFARARPRASRRGSSITRGVGTTDADVAIPRARTAATTTARFLGRRARGALALARVSESDDAPAAPAPPPADAATPPPPAPSRTFDPAVVALASEGVDAALARVDERLELAMRGEAAGSPDGSDDADALKSARAAAAAEDEAVNIVEYLRSVGSLRGYGAARLVPRRDYDLSELRLNNIEAEKLLSPTESTISGLRDVVQRFLLVLFGGWVFFARPSGEQTAGAVAFLGGALAFDQIAFGGGVEALILDTLAQATSPSYKSRLQLHEAAHFLVAYLMGILPKGYTLSSLDAYERYGALNVQAGCAFCDGAFQREVARGKIGSGSLGRFSCVALAGISMEYVAYGFAEGGVADVRQLDGLLRALAFSQKKSDSEVRWAVLNTISILRRHEGVVRKLAQKMAEGASVGSCVRLIEAELGEDV